MALPAVPARGAAGDAMDTNGLLNLDLIAYSLSSYIMFLYQYKKFCSIMCNGNIVLCVGDGWCHISASLEASAMINSTRFCLLPSVQEWQRVGDYQQLSKTKSLKNELSLQSQ